MYLLSFFVLRLLVLVMLSSYVPSIRTQQSWKRALKWSTSLARARTNSEDRALPRATRIVSISFSVSSRMRRTKNHFNGYCLHIVRWKHVNKKQKPYVRRIPSKLCKILVSFCRLRSLHFDINDLWYLVDEILN